jgi:hypothetical protein
MATQPSDPKSGPAPADAQASAPGGLGVPAATNAPSSEYVTRALLLWPGLDRGRLAGTRGDPVRIARLVARRTALPPETILRMLGLRIGARPTIEGRPPDD